MLNTLHKSCFSTIVGLIHVYLEDILSNNYKTVFKTINFIIEEGKRRYYEKNKLI